MQISASTLLASQQASQQASQRVSQVQPKPGFAQALEKASGFQSLPLKQAAVSGDAPSVAQPARGSQKPGSTIDIKV